MSSETTPQTNLAVVLSESAQQKKSQPLSRTHSKLAIQTSPQPIDNNPSTLLPASTSSLQQESKHGSDSSQADGEEIPASEVSCLRLPNTQMNLWPTEMNGLTDSPAGRPRLELPAECVSTPGVTQSCEREVAVGLSECDATISKGSVRSSAHHGGSTPARLSPAAEAQPRLGAGGEAPRSPELSESAGVTEVRQNLAVQSASASGEEEEEALQISPDTFAENLPNPLSEAEPQSDHVNRTLMPSIIALSGAVSLCVVLEEPSALFLIGLLLVLHHL